MRLKISLAVLAVTFCSSAAYADLEIYKDYAVSDAVWRVTTVKVKPNMGDAYLEGIKKTWVASSQVAKELGQIEDYKIYASDLPESGDFNVLLVVKFKNDEALAPNKARYDAFMAKWGEARNKETNEMAQRDYPAMRMITGEYQLREIAIK
ncbi:MAG: hypothetical protein WCF43_09485 [Steroidobacteraceae bacterium]